MNRITRNILKVFSAYLAGEASDASSSSATRLFIQSPDFKHLMLRRRTNLGVLRSQSNVFSVWGNMKP